MEESRTWHDKSGKFSVEAKFVKQDGSNVTLKKSDGKTITVPADCLSEEDVDYLQGR